MRRLNLIASVMVVGLLAAACGESASASSPSIEEYAGALIDIGNRTEAAIQEQGGDPPAGDYPLNAELVGATERLETAQDALNSLRALTPPPPVRAEHDALVAAVEEAQDAISRYLLESSLQSAEFEFDSIAAHEEIAELLAVWDAACRTLIIELGTLGAVVPHSTCAA